MNENQQMMYEDEIDIADIIRALIKWKKLIIGITILTTLLAAVYVFIKTPIYEVKSSIEIGKIGGSLVAEPNTLIKTLEIIYDVDGEIETEEKFVSRVSSVKNSKELPNFIEVVTEAVSNDEALKLNKQVLSYVQEEYKPIIEQYLINKNIQLDNVKNSIIRLEGFETDNLKRQIEQIKTQSIVKIDEQIAFIDEITLPKLENKLGFYTKKLEEYTKEIGDIYKSKENSNLVPLTVSSIQIVNYQNLVLGAQNKVEDLQAEIESIKERTLVDLQRKRQNLIDGELHNLEYKLNVEMGLKKESLENKIKQIEYDISEQRVKNSKIVGSYIVKNSPAKPKKPLILALGFILGLFLSFMLIIFLEAVKNLDLDSEPKKSVEKERTKNTAKEKK